MIQTKTRIFRIEVWSKQRPQTQLTGFDNVTVSSGRLFFLRGALTDDDVTRLCSELLADPVTDTFAIDSAYSTRGVVHTVDVTLLPGVTDSAAESLLNAAWLLEINGLENAATGSRHLLRGEVDAAALEEITTKILSNPVIQQVSIDRPIDAPFVSTQPGTGAVEVVALKDANDETLIAISNERRLSLNLEEMQVIRAYFASIEREPTDLEIEMLAQTWSEHCVHKTFRAKISYTGPAQGAPADSAPVEQEIDGLLKSYIRAATEKVNKPWVVSAFVDDAGIVRFDDDYDLAFKVETHNRPSALEPFGGANTGVGGVVRDVLGVSARPIANTDILFFGPPDLPDDQLPIGVLHPRRVAQGVVSGIEDYGNKMGIPTVNGAIFYHPGYTSNPLVFCGCLGILPRGSHRTGVQPGDLIVVVGGRTGRDGLRGATFSSMEMDTTTAQVSGGAVQIGHPIHEKQVLEVVLRARDEVLYNAITDCGAGGLSSAVGEMGEEVGARVQLQDVPLKYPGLLPWEIWLSEAQERMVLAVPSHHWQRLKQIADGQDIDATVIGTFEPTERLILHYGTEIVGDVSMTFLHDGLPQRHMIAEWRYAPSPQASLPSAERGLNGDGNQASEDFGETLLKLLAMLTIRSKEAVIRRYDHEIQGGTTVKPLVGVDNHGPSDATVLTPRPLTPNPSPTRGEGLTASGASDYERLNVPDYLRQKMIDVARRLRRESTPSEEKLWQALRNRQLNGRKFRRQQPVGAFVLDFYCAEEGLAIEVDGAVHETQQEADAERQTILESLGIRFVRVTARAVENDLDGVIEQIRAAFTASPSPLVGEGERGGEGPRGVALSVGLAPQYTDLDPYVMAWAAVDEAVRNLVAVGADPDQIAILDNFSWGNTNLPDRLGALVRCAQGCYDAAVAYGLPFISGKDSLNNEYLGEDGQRHAIPGTLVISALGIVSDVTETVTMDLKAAGNLLYVIGETRDEMGGSHYNLLHGIDGGTVPQPNPNAMATYRALHQAIQAGLVQSCHDVSEGGIAVALAEMCIAGRVGAELVTGFLRDHEDSIVFSEMQGALLVEIRSMDRDVFEEIFAALDGDLAVRVGMVMPANKLRLMPAMEATPSIEIAVQDLEHAWRGRKPQDEQPASHPIDATTQMLQPRPDRPNRIREGKPKVLILHANGTNRDRDAYLACELAGGLPEIVHINQLDTEERDLLDYHMLVVPGGFSYGDDMGAGVLWSLDLKVRFKHKLDRFIAEGRPVIGICNGFQTLVRSGVLPGAKWRADRAVTLTYNERQQFECRWVWLQPNPNSPCLFTQGLDAPLYVPVAHGEGRVMAKDQATLDDLWKQGLATLTYVNPDGLPGGYPWNPNGSVLDIAGLCNPAGNVFGLMPHPENHIFPWQHPRYHRGERGNVGLRLFENGIHFA